MRLLSGMLTAALLAAPAPLLAGAFVAPATIDAAVARFLAASADRPDGTARPVDPKLRLAACTAEISVAWYGRDQHLLLASCPTQGWRVFVPFSDGSSGGQSASPRAHEQIVQRGETVSTVVEGDGFTLTRQGEALEPGYVGQWIRIRPVGETATPLRGQVISPGMVRVSAG